jgi:hypothetical protein
MVNGGNALDKFQIVYSRESRIPEILLYEVVTTRIIPTVNFSVRQQNFQFWNPIFGQNWSQRGFLAVFDKKRATKLRT